MANQNIKLNQNTAKLKQRLEEMDEQFYGKDDIFGMTLLTNPGYISSARNIMFTNHLKQLLNLLNPDFPRVFTNYENIVGENSTGIQRARHNWVIEDKIYKFEENNHLYMLFVYDPDEDFYDVIQKKNVENLTEKFGFSYNNEFMDKLEVGDRVDKGEVMYKSTSYDEDNNYCYGKNATFMYLMDNDTIEDAVKVRKSFADELLNTEVETVQISLNDNDILCNIYGDDDNYKAFPDIMEKVVDKTVCAKRRIFNNQLLYDFKKSNLKKIDYSNDVLYFCDGVVNDITIYCNKNIDEIPDNPLYSQIKRYYKNELRYYEELYEKSKEILESGSKYSRDVDYVYKKSKEILDEQYKWKESDGSVFSNMVLQFEIARPVKLSVGSKVTGRYGNKGVVSVIEDDENMPFMENGKKVDVIFNPLGVPNRLNLFQLIEQSINFITDNVAEKMKTMKSNSEREKLLFDIIGRFNHKQSVALKEFYDNLDKKQKKAFYEQIYDNGIYIHIPPFWEDKAMFDTLSEIYDDYPWIQPYRVFINKFGRTIPMMNKMVVSEMYVMKLKQTAHKGFSVRATGSISKKGVPEKSDNAKKNKTAFKDTPVKLGIDENLNLMICSEAREIAKLHMFYRNSVKGRKDLGKALMTNMDTIEDFKLDNDIKNRNVEILQAYFKAMGLKLEFGKDALEIEINNGQINDEIVGDKLVIGDLDEINEEKIKFEAKRRLDEDLFIGSIDDYDEAFNKHYQDIKDEISGVDIQID